MVKSQPKNKVVTDVLCITETERKVLFLLNKDRESDYTVKKIVDKFDLDRTTIQKVLQKLANKGFIFRRQKNLHRGFLFVYKLSADIKDLKTYIKSKLEESHKKDFKLLDEAF